LFFHGKGGYANAPHHYIVLTLPFLLLSYFVIRVNQTTRRRRVVRVLVSKWHKVSTNSLGTNTATSYFISTIKLQSYSDAKKQRVCSCLITRTLNEPGI